MKYQPRYPCLFRDIKDTDTSSQSALRGFTTKGIFTEEFESIRKIKQLTLDAEYLYPRHLTMRACGKSESLCIDGLCDWS